MNEKIKVEVNGSTQVSTAAFLSLYGIEHSHICCLCLNIERKLSEPIKYVSVYSYSFSHLEN